MDIDVQRRASARGALLIVPALTVVIAACAIYAKSPYWLAAHYDPDYAYLLNALNLATGERSHFGGHPGTPVEILGALTLRVLHPLTSSADLVRAVLDDPERYRLSINVVLVAVVAGALVSLGSAVRARTGSTRLAAISQAAALVSAAVANSLSCVSPESFVFAAESVLVAVLLSYDRAPSTGKAAGLGALSGVIVAARITAFPILLLPLVVLRGWRPRAAFLAVSAAAAAIATAPAWRVLGRLVWQLEQMATHEGVYGRGSASPFDATAYAGGVGATLAEPVVWLGLVAAVVAWWATRRAAAGEQRVFFGGAVAILGCILVVAKHPSMHYLVPGTAIAVPLLALALGRIELRGVWGRAAPVVATAAVVWALWCPIHIVRAMAEGTRQALAASALVESRYPNVPRIYAWGASSPVMALQFGNGYAGHRYARSIGSMFPEAVFFEPWERTFFGPGVRSSFTAPADGRDVLFVLASLPLDEEQLAAFRYVPMPVFSTGAETVYEIRRTARLTAPSTASR